MKRLLHIIKKVPSYIIEIFYILFFYKYAQWKYKKYNIWLISERGNDARDNGMHLFKYIRTNYPEISIFYVIDANSTDIKNIKDYGNIIYSNTLKHRLYFYASRVLISTHLMGGFTTNQGFYMHFNKAKWFRKSRKIVSIKHGITKDDLPILYAEKAKLDLLIAGAKPEYDYMLKNFHYSNNNLKYTGFARFDNLFEHSEKNQILIMPTWRFYLSDLSSAEFQKSDFFIKWNKVLNNTRLITFLENNDLNIIFYPHYEIQKYIKEFSSKSKHIIIADLKHYDVQKLLKDSLLLITDFSSVYFDFAYMKKPIVYYHFDKDRFIIEHYNKGYFDYDTMGFGPVVNEEIQLINYIEYYAKNHFIVEEKYLNNTKLFFPLHDKNNCKRIFNEINNLLNSIDNI